MDVRQKKNHGIKLYRNYVKNQLSSDNTNQNYSQFEHQSPRFPEAYYRIIYEQYYKNRDKLIPYYWVPKWSGDVAEPSARVLDVYNA